MFKTIDKVRKILEAEVVDSHPFSFIPKFLYGADISMKIDEEFLCLDPSMVACDCCGVYTKRSEIKNIYDDGLDWHLCKKCTDTFSRVCKKCGNYFLPWHEESAEVFCPTCSIERWSEKEEGLNA